MIFIGGFHKFSTVSIFKELFSLSLQSSIRIWGKYFQDYENMFLELFKK